MLYRAVSTVQARCENHPGLLALGPGRNQRGLLSRPASLHAVVDVYSRSRHSELSVAIVVIVAIFLGGLKELLLLIGDVFVLAKLGRVVIQGPLTVE